MNYNVERKDSDKLAGTYYHCTKTIFIPVETIFNAIYEYAKEKKEILINDLYFFLSNKFKVKSFNKKNLRVLLCKYFDVKSQIVILNDNFKNITMQQKEEDHVSTKIYNLIKILGFDLLDDIFEKGLSRFLYYIESLNNDSYNKDLTIKEELSFKYNYITLRDFINNKSLSKQLDLNQFKTWFKENHENYIEKYNNYIKFNYLKLLLNSIPITNYNVNFQLLVEPNLIFINNIKTIKELVKEFNYNIYLQNYKYYNNMEKLFLFLNKDISSIIFNIYSNFTLKMKRVEVLKLRSEGKTLEEIGFKFGLTRERIRQIEVKLLKKYQILITKSNILNLIISVSNSNHVITCNEIKNIFGNDYMTFIYIIKRIEIKSFQYIEDLDLFDYSELNWYQDIYDFYDELPSKIDKNYLQSKINGFALNFNDDKEFYIEYSNILIFKLYNKLGDVYSKNSLKYIDKYRHVVEKYFHDGIYIYNEDHMNKFIKYYIKEFNDTSIVKKSARSHQGIFSRFCCLVDKGKYDIEDKIPELDIEMLDLIERYINKIGGVALYSSIYNHFEDKLIKHNVKNKYILQGILKKQYGQKYFYYRDYLSKDEDSNYRNVIIEFANTYNSKFSLKDISRQFPYINKTIIENALSSCVNIINLNNKTWVSKQNLFITEDVKSNLFSYLTKIISKNGTLTSQVIYDNAIINFSKFLDVNKIDNKYGLFNIIKYIFSDYFNFKSPFISSLDIELKNTIDNIIDYIYEFDEIYLNDLKDYLDDNGLNRYSITEIIKSVNIDYIRVDEEKIVNISSIGINDIIIAEVKRIVSKYLHYKNGVNMNNINYNLFPNINYKWNKYVLSSVIESKIEEFVSFPTNSNYTITDYIVVKKELDINNYKDYFNMVKGVK